MLGWLVFFPLYQNIQENNFREVGLMGFIILSYYQLACCSGSEADIQGRQHVPELNHSSPGRLVEGDKGRDLDN